MFGSMLLGLENPLGALINLLPMRKELFFSAKASCLILDSMKQSFWIKETEYVVFRHVPSWLTSNFRWQPCWLLLVCSAVLIRYPTWQVSSGSAIEPCIAYCWEEKGRNENFRGNTRNCFHVAGSSLPTFPASSSALNSGNSWLITNYLPWEWLSYTDLWWPLFL